MSFRITSFWVWAVVSTASMFWLLRLTASPYPAPDYVLSKQDAQFAGADLSRLLGATSVMVNEGQAAAPEASRFQLTGVVAGRTPDSALGVALISVDGKPPKPFSVGAPVDGEWVVQSVVQRSVAIGPPGGAAAVTLELPVLPDPATGNLPTAVMQ